MLLLEKKAMKNLDSLLKSRQYFANKGSFNQSHIVAHLVLVHLVKASSDVRMWELAHEQGWMPKNRCFWTVVEKTLESPMDCKEIQPVNPKENKSCIFIGKTDAEAPIHWPPDVKNWLIGKEHDAGEDWRQEEKGRTGDEMVGWHHRLTGHHLEQAPEVGDGQRSLVCCSPRGHNGSDMEWLNWLTGTVARVGSRIRPLTQKWKPHIGFSSSVLA